MAVGNLVDVVMPQMGVSVSEGTISRWARQVGERIEADETIVEISTDKVDTEVPSPASGTIAELIVPEGETVPVGTAIARIATGDAPIEAAAAPAPAASPAAAAVPPPHFGPGTPDGGYAAEVVAAPANGAADADESMRTFMSPVVARMVAEHDLQIARIPGSGRGGRVTKNDVESYLAARVAAPSDVPAVPPTPPPAVEPIAAPAAVLSPAPAAPAPAAPSPRPSPPALVAGTAEEVYRFSTIRKAIARHMMESIHTTAQLTSVVEIDMTAIVNYRKELKPLFQQRHGVSLTFLPFIMKATIDAIGAWPWLNAEIRGDEALVKHYVNLGMAVAVDDAKGLLVPVIKNAESLSMVGLARALSDVAERARKKQLTPDEMAGGTFTITNPGGFGAIMGTPLLPVGTTAIIDVEAIVKRPVVVTDQLGNDSIAIRSMMYLPMTYDHRLVDGAYAGQFLRDLKRNLETWPIDAYTA